MVSAKDSAMEALTYLDFSLGLHQKMLDQRLPLEGTIEVTHRCPMKCLHCYNNLPIGDQEAQRKELTVREHCRILDEIAKAGCLWLLYTGGEIFARKDFLEIYTYGKGKGLLITLFTNGILITPEIADYLKEWPPFSIEITLYGCTQKTYESITGLPGSYERCLRGIHLLMERGLPLKLKTVVLTLNHHEIWKIKQFVEEDLGLEFKFDAMVNPRLNGAKTPLEVRLRPEEIVELDRLDPRRMAEWSRFSEKFSGPAHSSRHGERLYQCGGGNRTFSISPDGGLTVCVLSPADAFNLRKSSFQKGWEEFLLKIREKKVTGRTKCISCEIKAICGMCPANGMLENNDPEGPVDFLCQVAHLRAKALGLSIKPHGACEYCK
jgi:radical SAM protein with 4Fe4S-binding SPASM domain